MTEYDGWAWQIGLTEEQIPEVRRLLARVRDVDHRGPVDSDIPDSTASVLVAADGSTVVGLAWYRGSDPAELYVDPAHRGRGVGHRLADAAMRATSGVWAHGTHPAAQALARSLGARVTRELLQLRRAATGPLAIDLPDDVVIRTFVPGADDAEFLAVNARAFAWHPEQGRLDRPALDGEKAQGWFDPDGFFLAVRGSAPRTVLGFHWTKIHSTDPTPPPDAPPQPIGEVYVIAVDPRSPTRGLGGPLTAAGLNYLADQGLSTTMLYVESDNDRALRLYERLGFTRYAVDTVYATGNG